MSNPTALVQKLWNYCNILRDDGLSYGDYVEQLTFLLSKYSGIWLLKPATIWFPFITIRADAAVTDDVTKISLGEV